MKKFLLLMVALPAMLGVVAAPATAAECPNAEIRAQQQSEYLPNCGAYELVSPANKNGGSVLIGLQQAMTETRLSPAGDRVSFGSYGSFAGSPHGAASSYLSTRTPGGWTTENVTPTPQKPMANGLSGDTYQWQTVDPGFASGIVYNLEALTPAKTDNEASDLWRTGPGREPELLTIGTNGEHSVPGNYHPYYRTLADGKTTVFASDAAFDSRIVATPFVFNVYVRADGVTRLVNVASDGSPIDPLCGAAVGGISAQGGTDRNALSADGSQIVFTVPAADAAAFSGCSPAAPARVFLRHGATTTEVSASQRSAPDPGGAMPAVYQGATSDGKRIFFSSRAMLTDDAIVGGGLYAFDVDSGILRLLFSSSDFKVLDVTDDGDVYVVSTSPVEGQVDDQHLPCLYIYRHDSEQVHLIGVDRGANELIAAPDGALGTRPIGLSDEGDLAFAAAAMLFEGDERYFGGDSFDPYQTQVYLYRRADDTVVCVSCDPAGQRPADSSVRGPARLSVPRNYQVPGPASFSADGSVLAFLSPDRLTADDTDDNRDVYTYSDGRLSLISSGHDRDLAIPLDVSADGKTVGFVTQAALVPEDTDGGDSDVYVARSGGGFASAVKPDRPLCSGDECQGAQSTPPPAAASDSERGTGLGETAVVRPAISVKSSVAGTVATLKVTTTAAGKLGVSGGSIARVSRNVTKAGTSTVKVRLTKKAAASLKRTGVVRARVKVVLSPHDGKPVARSLSLTFKRKAAARSKARSAR